MPQVATRQPISALLIPHAVEGQEQCNSCHQDSMPEDHAGREDDTCLACHDPAPPTQPVPGDSALQKGRIIWQTRAHLSCRDCHGAEGQGGFGPSLVDTSLDPVTFIQRVRAPASEAMPPIAASLDDPNYERSGMWIGDEDLLLVYGWLTGMEVQATPSPESPTAGSIPHALEGMEACLACHAEEGSLPLPDDHAGWTVDSCLDCHVPQ